MKDKSGNKIEVGDFIVYATLLGRSAGLQYGRVLEVSDHRGKIRVRGVRDRLGNRLELLKPSWLTYTDRCHVVPEDSICTMTLVLLKGGGVTWTTS